MDISPRPVVVSLKDGSNHTLFKFRDFLELVDQAMGMEAAKWLETYVKQCEEAADYTKQAVESDLFNYESNLESNEDAFREIQREAAAIMKVMEAPRIDRQKITHAIQEIEKIIDNQI